MTRLEGLDLRKSGDILKIGFVCPRVGLIATNFFWNQWNPPMKEEKYTNKKGH